MTKAPLLFGSWILGTLACFAEPSLTIYNQNFAMVRDTVPLDLKAGVNPVTFSDITAQMEPDSVVLRDPTGKVQLQILEQNYRNDPVTQDLLLSLFEGKTIDFVTKGDAKPDVTVQGKIIRSGYVPRSAGGGSSQPVIEVNGKIQFGLPGQPIFPSLGDDTILKPMITWQLNADAPGKLSAELGYITGGMKWNSSYNIVAPEVGDIIDVIGWITMDNQSGKTFTNAKIKLVAGDVNKIQPPTEMRVVQELSSVSAPGAAPQVTEKAFDEYHLYSLPRETTLHDGETKQVEFIHASGVKSQKVYTYDGIDVQWGMYGSSTNMQGFRDRADFGGESNTKVAVTREFKNSEANHLGIALPKGRVRFYRKDGDQLQFTGENLIDHTAKDELIKLYTGNAFDLVGERKRTDFHVDSANNGASESFEIKLRNHKKEAVEIRVVEHLYRWTNWQIQDNTAPFVKTNAQEIEFRIPVQPDEEKVLSYQVHYSW